MKGLSYTDISNLIDMKLVELEKVMNEKGLPMINEIIEVYKSRKSRCPDIVSLAYLYMDIQESITFC